MEKSNPLANQSMVVVRWINPNANLNLILNNTQLQEIGMGV